MLKHYYNFISEEDSYDLVTCYCTKPFAGRPMIECSKCLTWIHLSCAKIKKTNIPEVFICVKCKNRKFSSVTSSSSVRHKKRVSVWSVSRSGNIRLMITLYDQLGIFVECLKCQISFPGEACEIYLVLFYASLWEDESEEDMSSIALWYWFCVWVMAVCRSWMCPLRWKVQPMALAGLLFVQWAIADRKWIKR